MVSESPNEIESKNCHCLRPKRRENSADFDVTNITTLEK